jgi:hypothetical protein
VRAVLVSEESMREARLERGSQAAAAMEELGGAAADRPAAAPAAEEVFIAQLHRRARLLNEGFQVRYIYIFIIHLYNTI